MYYSILGNEQRPAFVDKKEEDKATCVICLKILQNPHQSKCCAKRFCCNCMKSTTVCPVCSEGSVFYDKSFEQQLKQFKVYCPNQTCNEVIEYGYLNEHLNLNPSVGKEIKGCQYSEIKCRNGKCGMFVQRQCLIRHEQLECPLLQRDILKNVFNSECQAIKSQVNTQLCQKDMEIVKLRQKIAQCRASEESNNTVPAIRILRDFSKMKEKNKDCMLKPFYTHKNGYKVGICVVPNGYNEAEGTHVSLFTFMEKGENDDYLPWPFHGNIIIQLLDHSSNFAHREVTIRYNDYHPGYSNRNHLGIVLGGQGKYHLISHASLDDNKHVQFLKNDCLHFRICEVERDMSPQNKEMGWLLIFVTFIILSMSVHLLFFFINDALYAL